MGYVDRISGRMSGILGRMDLNDWLILACFVVVFGLLCLRGFGSRTDY